MSTLQIASQFSDFTTDPLAAQVYGQDVTTIEFASGGTLVYGVFLADQFGSPDISATVVIKGSQTVDRLRIAASDAFATNVNASGWQFSDWSGEDDAVEIFGSTFADTIVGSSSADVILDLGGGDNVASGGGDDFFEFKGFGGVDATGVSLNGGDGFDTLLLQGQIIDFRAVSLTSIDQVVISHSTAFFSGDQIGLDGIQSINFTNGGSFLVVEGATVVLAPLQIDVGAGGGVIVTAASGVDSALIGSTMNDFVLGGTGDDRLDGYIGADYLAGGDGFDFATYNLRTGVVASLELGGGFGGDATGDVFVGIEGLEGSSFQDLFWGDANSNTLRGLGGNDFLFGGADDRVEGGAGEDYMEIGANGAAFGGGGFDTFVVSGADAVIDLTGDLEAGVFETITAGAGTSYLVAESFGTLNAVDTANGVFVYAPTNGSFWGFLVTNTHSVEQVIASTFYID